METLDVSPTNDKTLITPDIFIKLFEKESEKLASR